MTERSLVLCGQPMIQWFFKQSVGTDRIARILRPKLIHTVHKCDKVQIQIVFGAYDNDPVLIRVLK